MQTSLLRHTFRFLSTLFVGCCLVVGQAMAAAPFKIADIRVEGLQRVEAGTVFASLPFRAGDDYTDDKAVWPSERCSAYRCLRTSASRCRIRWWSWWSKNAQAWPTSISRA